MIYLVMFLFIFISSLILGAILFTIKCEIVASRILDSVYSDKQNKDIICCYERLSNQIAILDEKLNESLREVESEKN